MPNTAGVIGVAVGASVGGLLFLVVLVVCCKKLIKEKRNNVKPTEPPR